MAVKTDRSAIWLNIIGVFLFLLLSAVAGMMFGLFSGLVLAAACLNLRGARRSGDPQRRLTARICVVVAGVGAGSGYFVWQWLLWDQHYHPGAGGAIPPPTHWDLATMPLISAGLGVAFLILVIAGNALLKRLGLANKPATPQMSG